MKPSIDRSTVIGLLLVVALVMGWGVFSWRAAAEAAEAGAQAEEAQRVLTLLAALRGAASEAELAADGAASPAEALAQARAAVDAQANALREVLARHADQYSRLVALGPLLTRYFDALATGSAPQPRRPATAAVAPGPGDARRLLERVRAGIAEMQAPATKTAADALQRSRSQARLAQGLVAGGAAVLALGMAALMLWLQQQRRAAVKAVAQSRADRRVGHEASAVMDRLLNLVPDALGLIDTEGRFVRVNAGAQTLWGWTEQELRGQACTHLIAPEDQRRTEQAFTGWMAAGADARSQTLRNHCKRKDGRVIEVQWHAAWLADEQQLLFIARDVTEVAGLRTQAAQQAEALTRTSAELAATQSRLADTEQQRGEFITGTGQALRAPAGTLLGLTALLKDSLGDLQADQRRHVTAIHGTANQLHAMVGHLMDIAHSEAGRLQLAHEPIDLWESIHKVATELKPRAELKGLALQLELADDLGYAHGDSRRVEQILHALLERAVAFGETGRIVLQAAPQSDGTLRIAVVDAGPPVEAEFLANLFAPFALGPAAGAAAPVPNQDLSLPVAQRLARAMGGQIAASRDAGPGNLFVLTLPQDAIAAR